MVGLLAWSSGTTHTQEHYHWVARQRKQLAVDVAQALTTYEAGTRFRSLVAEVARGRDRRRATLVAAAPLFHADTWSRGRIVYPQLGGLTAERMSVVVVVEQRVGTARAERTVTRTMDVRLVRKDKAWVFDKLASAGGTQVDRPADLPAAAAAVVDIYAFDQQPVVDDRVSDATTRTHVEWLLDRPEVAELGSPWALDSSSGRSFTDVVHRDHVHVGVAS